MCAPGISAILTRAVRATSLRRLGWKLGRPRYLVPGYLLPVGYVLTVCWGSAGLGLLRFGPQAFSLGLLVMFVSGPFINIIGALGEEIGWRGLLLPELPAHLGYTKASLMVGGIWAVWEPSYVTIAYPFQYIAGNQT
jgi:membrane protease YdiL (CAAX protease family)